MQTKSMRGRGEGGGRRRNTGEGNDWKNTREKVLIGWNDTEEGRANEGDTGQVWREDQAGEEHKN